MAVSTAVRAESDQVGLGRTSFKEKVIMGTTPKRAARTAGVLYLWPAHEAHRSVALSLPGKGSLNSVSFFDQNQGWAAVAGRVHRRSLVAGAGGWHGSFGVRVWGSSAWVAARPAAAGPSSRSCSMTVRAAAERGSSRAAAPGRPEGRAAPGPGAPGSVQLTACAES